MKWLSEWSDDNVLAAKKSELTSLQKKRHSQAAQRFILGAKDFLVQYNQKITSVIDVDKMRKNYQAVLENKVKSVEQKTQNSQKQKAEKKGNHILGTIVLLSVGILGGYLVFRNRMERIYDSYKMQLNQLIENSLYGNRFLVMIDSYVKEKTGIGFILEFNRFFINAMTNVSASIVCSLARGFDFFLNGRFMQYKNSDNEVEKVTLATKLFNDVAVRAYQDASQKSGLSAVLRLFGLEMNYQIINRPNLKDYFKLGADYVKQITAADESARGIVRTTEQMKDSWAWYDEYDNRYSIDPGENDNQLDDLEIGGVQYYFREYTNSIIEKAAGQYSKDIQIGMMGQELNPFDEKYMRLLHAQDNLSSVQVDIDGRLFDVSFEELRYEDTTFTSELIQGCHFLLNKYNNESSPVIKRAREELGFLESKRSFNYRELGELIYLRSVLIVYDGYRVNQEMKRKDIALHDIIGRSSLSVQQKMIRSFIGKPIFQKMKLDVIGGNMGSNEYMDYLIYYTDTILKDIISDTQDVKSQIVLKDESLKKSGMDIWANGFKQTNPSLKFYGKYFKDYSEIQQKTKFDPGRLVLMYNIARRKLFDARQAKRYIEQGVTVSRVIITNDFYNYSGYNVFNPEGLPDEARQFYDKKYNNEAKKKGNDLFRSRIDKSSYWYANTSFSRLQMDKNSSVIKTYGSIINGSGRRRQHQLSLRKQRNRLLDVLSSIILV